MPDELVIADPDRWDGTVPPIVNKLDRLLHNNPDLFTLLNESIKKAQKNGPSGKMNPVSSYPGYRKFVARSAKLLPRDAHRQTGEPLRDHVLQACNYFYFLINQHLPELEGQGYYKAALQYEPRFGDWVREFAHSWGSYLDEPASWDWNLYRQYYEDESFHLSDDWYEPASSWDSFNRFFSRYLRDPGVRPIAHASDDSVVTSPADSTPRKVWKIDGNGNIHVEGEPKMKPATGAGTYPVDDLLKDGSPYAGTWDNGRFTHTFLNVNDYHRYHFPVGGTVETVQTIPANASLPVSWNEQKGKYVAADTTGWQFSQTRGYVILRTQGFGRVCVVLVGMAHVSSVNFEDRVSPGHEFRKGDMLGHFLYGGSDIIMLFEEQANFDMTTKPKQHVKMGEEYGTVDAA